MLLGQLTIFRDYIAPLQWGQIKVSSLACTCPDEEVINGQFYLKAITPDSLKLYNLDYSEIYVSEQPNTDIDLLGGPKLSIIKGPVIGKRRVSKNDPWNPIVRVDERREVDILKDWGLKALFFAQLLFFWALLIHARNVK